MGFTRVQAVITATCKSVRVLMERESSLKLQAMFGKANLGES